MESHTATTETAAPVRGSFAERQLAAEGLLDIVEDLRAGRELQLPHVLCLARAGMPALAKIVEMCRVPASAADGLPVQRVDRVPPAARRTGQPLDDCESFCRRLLEIREEARGVAGPIEWYPVIPGSPDDSASADDGTSGVEVLRAISLARLVLPAHVTIRAPLALLGARLALAALSFGASDLGWAAPDGQSPADPLVADPGLLAELDGCLIVTLLCEN
jgi:hypothetical protein